MDERILQTRVGIMVISTILLTAFLIVVLGGGNLPFTFRPGKTVYATFRAAPGVAVGTPVRKNGILIGRVSDVRLDKEDVRVAIKLVSKDGEDAVIDATCRVSGSILGDAVIEFARRDKPVPPGETEDGSPSHPFKGEVVASPVDTLSRFGGEMTDTARSIKDASDEVQKLAKTVNKLIEGKDAGQLDNVLKKTDAAMTSFDRSMKNLDGLVGDPKVQKDMKDSLANLSKLLEEGRDTKARMDDALRKVNQRMDDLEPLTTSLRAKGKNIVERLNSSVTNLDAALSRFSGTLGPLDGPSDGRQEGTLGLLMKNPELYNELLAAARNINDLAARTRPVIEDARVFTSKIARDPGRLGVSGALQRNSRTKYPNYGEIEPPQPDWHVRPPDQELEPQPRLVPAP